MESRDELISDVLLWNPSHGRAKAGRPARTYIQQLCEDTGCSPDDLPEAMNDSERRRERVRDIHADGTTWWWWWWCLIADEEIVILKLRVGWLNSFFILIIIIIIIIMLHCFARISQTFSRHLSLSSIAPGRSWKQHPVSAQNYW